MTAEDRIAAFRRLVFSGIKRALEIDGYCKPWEGSIEVAWPDYFASLATIDKPRVVVKLYCYVLGPSRHYEWSAPTLRGALSKATKDVRRWIKELDEQ